MNNTWQDIAAGLNLLKANTIDYWEFGSTIEWENPIVCYDWNDLPINKTIQIISVEVE